MQGGTLGLAAWEEKGRKMKKKKDKVLSMFREEKKNLNLWTFLVSP